MVCPPAPSTALRAALALAAALSCAACPPPDDAPPSPDPPTPPGWRMRALSEVETPQARWGQIPAYTSGPTYFFGGAAIELANGQGDVLADVWRLDPEPLQFVQVPSVGEHVPRYCGCAAIDEDSRTALVMGGRDQANMVIRDAWLFSLDDGSWEPITGPVPDGMVGCGAVFIPGTGTAYLFGGGAASFASSATLKFDLATRAFTQLAIPGPSARFDHQLRPSTDFSHLWLVSGALTAVTGFSSEVWRFDVASESWSLLEVTGEQPPGRRTPWVAIRDDDGALVMGLGTAGLAPNSDLGDMWLLDLAAARWQRLDVKDMIAPRAFTYFLRAPAGGVGMIYGGTDMEHALDDLWVLEPPEGDAHTWH